MWLPYLKGSDFPADIFDQGVFCYQNDRPGIYYLWKAAAGNWYISQTRIGPVLAIGGSSLYVVGIINGKSAWGPVPVHQQFTGDIRVYWSNLRGAYVYYADGIPEEYTMGETFGRQTNATSLVANPDYPAYEKEFYNQDQITYSNVQPIIGPYYTAPALTGPWTVHGIGGALVSTLTYPAATSATFCGDYGIAVKVGWRKFTGGPSGRTFQEIWYYHNAKRILLSNDELYNVWWDSSVSKYVCSTKCGTKDLSVGYWEGGATWAGLYTYFVNPPNPVLPDFTLVFGSYVDNTAFPLYTQKQAYMAETPVGINATELKVFWNSYMEKIFKFVTRYQPSAFDTLRLFRENLLYNSGIQSLAKSNSLANPLYSLMNAVRGMFPTENASGYAGTLLVESSLPAANNMLYFPKALKANPYPGDPAGNIAFEGWIHDPAKYSKLADCYGKAIDEATITYKNEGWRGNPASPGQRIYLLPADYYIFSTAQGDQPHDLSICGWKVNADSIVPPPPSGGDLTDTAAVVTYKWGAHWNDFWPDYGLVIANFNAQKPKLIPMALSAFPGTAFLFSMTLASHAEVNTVTLHTIHMEKSRRLAMVRNLYPFDFRIKLYAYRKRRYKRFYERTDPDPAVSWYEYNTDVTYSPQVLVVDALVPAYSNTVVGNAEFPDTDPDLYAGAEIPANSWRIRNIYEEWYCNWYIERIS